MITISPVVSKKDSPVLYGLLLAVIGLCLFLMTMLPCNSLADDIEMPLLPWQISREEIIEKMWEKQPDEYYLYSNGMEKLVYFNDTYKDGHRIVASLYLYYEKLFSQVYEFDGGESAGIYFDNKLDGEYESFEDNGTYAKLMDFCFSAAPEVNSQKELLQIKNWKIDENTNAILYSELIPNGLESEKHTGLVYYVSGFPDNCDTYIDYTFWNSHPQVLISLEGGSIDTEEGLSRYKRVGTFVGYKIKLNPYVLDAPDDRDFVKFEWVNLDNSIISVSDGNITAKSDGTGRVYRFLQALEELKNKMLLCGHRDYVEQAGALILELKENLRQDLAEKGHVDLPTGGRARIQTV